MGTSDGEVIGLTKVADHGDAALRWNVVVLGDGYQHAQLPQFHDAVQSFVDTIRTTDPYQELWSGINLYRIDVASTDTGADDAADQAGGSGAGGTVRTYFDASFGNNGIHRLLEVNDATVHTVVNNQLPQAHMIIVIVNSTDYGGFRRKRGDLLPCRQCRRTARDGLYRFLVWPTSTSPTSAVASMRLAPTTATPGRSPAVFQYLRSTAIEWPTNGDSRTPRRPCPQHRIPTAGTAILGPTHRPRPPVVGVRGRRLLSLWSVPAPVQLPDARLGFPYCAVRQGGDPPDDRALHHKLPVLLRRQPFRLHLRFRRRRSLWMSRRLWLNRRLWLIPRELYMRSAARTPVATKTRRSKKWNARPGTCPRS